MTKSTHDFIPLYSRLLGYVKRFWPLFIVAAIGNILYAAVDAGSMYLFRPLLNQGFIGKDMQFLHIFPLIIIGLFLLRGVGSFTATYSLGYIGRNVVLRFRQQLFKKILYLPARYFDGVQTGQLLSKLLYNVDQVEQATTQSVTIMVREGGYCIGLLVVMLINSWKLTILIFLVIPVVAFFVKYVSKRFRKLSYRIQKAMGDIAHVAEESIYGYRDIRIFGAQKKQEDSFNSIIHYNYKQERKVIFMDGISTPIIQFFGGCVIALIIYFVFHSHTPLLSAGAFVSFFAAALAILKPVKNVTQINSTIQRALAAAESVFEVLDHEEEVDEGKHLMVDVKGSIEYKDISFGYDDNKTILNQIDLSIKPGSTVAFVGRSGGGKSTLVSLLARFYAPTAGVIQLDGVDIQDIDLAHLRQQISLVSQHVTLFDDTIYNNIVFAENDVSEKQVMQAAVAAHAWDFIELMPEGMKTRVGQNGLNLSGGQRQRIAIARAILKNAPILILDEATSALDYESEKTIQEALEHLKQGRTTVVIAHRLSTIESADNIVVMDEGKVVEMGTHQDLMSQGGAYAKLQSMATF